MSLDHAKGSKKNNFGLKLLDLKKKLHLFFVSFFTFCLFLRAYLLKVPLLSKMWKLLIIFSEKFIVFRALIQAYRYANKNDEVDYFFYMSGLYMCLEYVEDGQRKY